MAQMKITPEQIDRAADLQRRGWSVVRIAADLGVHRNSVGRALARYNARIYERLVRRTAGERGRQLAILESVIDAALAQWERSVGDATTVRETADINGIVDETVTTTKTQTGDPRLLAEARNALAERRKILGLDRVEDDGSEDPLIVAEMVKASYAPEDE